MKDQSKSPIILESGTRLHIMQSAKKLLKLADKIEKFNVRADLFLKQNEVIAKDERVLQKTKDESKKQENNFPDAFQQIELQRLYHWNELIRQAQHTRHLIKKSILTAKEILNELEKVRIDVNSKDWQEGIEVLRQSECQQGLLTASLIKSGIDSNLAHKTIKSAAKEKKSPNLKSLLTSLEAANDDFSKRINKKMLKATNAEEQKTALTSDSTGVGSTAAGLIAVIGIGAAIGVIAIVGGTFALTGIGYGIEDLFNATDDDHARQTIFNSSCETLNAIPLQSKIDFLINPILSGPTTNDDERAILRLLNCASPTQVREIVSTIGLHRLMDEFQGSQWDHLVIRLWACGLLSLSEWDDDATRLFINSNNCHTLNSLNLIDIRQLILNMFSGDCDNDDENAIIRLIKCLPCNRVRTLEGMPGMSFDDFDDSVDGDEWDELEGLFNGCGIFEE